MEYFIIHNNYFKYHIFLELVIKGSNFVLLFYIFNQIELC
jgi:hypothetical protein